MERRAKAVVVKRRVLVKKSIERITSPLVSTCPTTRGHMLCGGG
jgi:hypothetical protein